MNDKSVTLALRRRNGQVITKRGRKPMKVQSRMSWSMIVVMFSVMLGCQPGASPVGSLNSVFSYAEDNRTLAERIKAGKYDIVYYDQDIVEENFPIHRPNKVGPLVGVDRVFVHLKKTASTNEVFRYMDVHNLRSARIEELLKIGEENPDVQRDFPVVALGSTWVDSDGYLRAKYLSNSNGFYRYLSLTPVFFTNSSLDDSPFWYEGCRFLAFPK